MQSSRHSESAILTLTDCILGIKISLIIIRCEVFFLFLGREPTTWPANKCLQIIVCSCVMSSLFWLQTEQCFAHAQMEHLFSPSFDISRIKVADRFAGLSETIEEDIYWKTNSMIKQSLISVIAKYRDLSLSRRWIFLPRNWQITIFYAMFSTKQQFRSPIGYDFVFLPRS